MSLRTARLFIVAAILLPLATWGQNILRLANVPADPLELATGQIQSVETPEDHAAVLKLLNRARDNYLIRRENKAYDLKFSLTATSGGATQFDGVWQMEEFYVPKTGVHWTAATTGYSTTQIRTGELFYRDAP